VLLLALLGGAGLALAQQRQGENLDLASLLRVGEPIGMADQRLLQLGWRPAGSASSTELDRERSSTPLASLSGCSGTGQGYCRFDYRRGTARLAVITLPAAGGLQGEPRVLRWLDDTSGRRWGQCQSDSSGELIPCSP
jgi:hypothetical protein